MDFAPEVRTLGMIAMDPSFPERSIVALENLTV